MEEGSEELHSREGHTTSRPSGGADSVYLDLIKEQVVEERSRKLSIEGRGLSLAGTSGLLATILFGLTAFASSTELVIDAGLKWFIGIALIALLTSTLLGVVVSWLRSYQEPTLENLGRLLGEGFWQGRAIIGTRRVAEVNLMILRSARLQNDRKSRVLQAALAAEVLGIGAIAAAVALVILRA